METILGVVMKMAGSHFTYKLVGLRPGEKLHEDMLAETELPYTFVPPVSGLLAVRPQYTKRNHCKDWKKYRGKEFNSSLHVSDSMDDLDKLINRGLSESD